MPRLIHPDQPAEIEVAITVIGSRARLQILHFLSKHGPATAKQIAEGTAISRPSVNAHLTTLEKCRAIYAHSEGEDRNGRTVLYQIDKNHVEGFIHELLKFVTGK